MKTQPQGIVTVDQVFESIDVAIKNTQINAAVKMLERLQSISPMTSQLALNICRYAMLVEQFGIAQQSVRQALKHEPNNPMLWNRLGLIQKRQGFFPQALRSYERSHALDFTNQEAASAMHCLQAYHASVEATAPDQQETVVIVSEQLRQPIRLSVTPSALKWVEHYKYNIVEYAKSAHARLQRPIDERLHLLLYYFCEYIVLDWLMLKPLLSSPVERMLNIGGGIGLLEPLLSSEWGASTHHTLIELALMEQVEHFAEEDKAHAFQEPIPIMQTARDVFEANGLQGCTKAVASEDASLLMSETYDCIISIRSLSFLYPLETYLELILATLTPTGVLILDVSKTNGDMQTLQQHFSDIQMVNEFAGARRVVCRR